jgi:hypothetical protein
MSRAKFRATSQSHIQQWLHNRRFLAQIPPDYPDWQVTVAFYAALHSIDALLAFDKVIDRVINHDTRNAVLMHTNKYAFLNKKYQPLYSLARTVRYLADRTKWVPSHTIQANVIGRYLFPIEQSVQKLMGQEIVKPDVVIQTVPLLTAPPGTQTPPTGGI